MRPVPVGALLAAVFLAAAATRGAAQRQPSLIPRGVAVGMTGDLWVWPDGDGFALPMVTLHVSDLRPGRVTPEFALGVSPQAALAGAAFLLTDLDVAYNTSLPRVTLMVNAGASAAVLLGAGSAGGALGANAGLGALVRIANGFGLRINASYRPFLADGGILSTVSFGLGLTSLPRAFR